MRPISLNLPEILQRSLYDPLLQVSTVIDMYNNKKKKRKQMGGSFTVIRLSGVLKLRTQDAFRSCPKTWKQQLFHKSFFYCILFINVQGILNILIFSVYSMKNVSVYILCQFSCGIDSRFFNVVFFPSF